LILNPIFIEFRIQIQTVKKYCRYHHLYSTTFLHLLSNHVGLISRITDLSHIKNTLTVLDASRIRLHTTKKSHKNHNEGMLRSRIHSHHMITYMTNTLLSLCRKTNWIVRRKRHKKSYGRRWRRRDTWVKRRVKRDRPYTLHSNWNTLLRFTYNNELYAPVRHVDDNCECVAIIYSNGIADDTRPLAIELPRRHALIRWQCSNPRVIVQLYFYPITRKFQNTVLTQGSLSSISC